MRAVDESVEEQSMNPAIYYRWKDIPTDQPMPKLERKRITADKMMVQHIRLQKGCEVPMHSHANEQIACVQSGMLQFSLDDSPNGRRMVNVGAGDVLVLPANVPHAAVALEDTFALDIFCPPSQTTGIDVGKK
jgi:quercetin dioxygenase-like cupin family protein